MTQVNSIEIFGDMVNRIKKTKLTFQPGPNVIIGPNGSGKSTLFSLLTSKSNNIKDVCKIDSIAGDYYIFDFEKDNPRKRDYIKNGFDVVSRMKSHGEVNKLIIKKMNTEDVSDVLFLLDEPEQALDMNGLRELLEIIKTSNAKQILINTHHPFLILDKIFNVVELEDGYFDKIVDFTIGMFEKTTG
jgi:predicted ATPase